MEWFESKGAGIYFPIGHSPHADFIAEFDDAAGAGPGEDVHVLGPATAGTSRVCTRGGNRSWSGRGEDASIPSRCDFLFVLVGDGRRWCHSRRAACSTDRLGSSLGGPKYGTSSRSNPAAPLPYRTATNAASTIGLS